MLAFLAGLALCCAVSFGFQPLFSQTPYAILSAFVTLPEGDWIPMAVNVIVFLGLSLLLELILFRDSKKRKASAWGSALGTILFLLGQF